MSKIAFVYPGQGAQKKDMGIDFFDNKAFDVASDCLNLDVRKMIKEGSSYLDETKYTQASILAVEIAITDEVLKLGIKPSITAGLSLGEYAAIYGAGGIASFDALNIAAIRGKLMDEAVPSGIGAMTAVLGLNKEKVELAIKDVDDIWIANYNTETQIIITGRKSNMEEAINRLKEEGAKLCKELKVSGPFHSPLLNKAGEELKTYLNKVTFNDLTVPYISNVTGDRVVNKDNIKELLSMQVSNPVKWEQSVKLMLKEGIDTFIEIGHSKTLTNMIKKISKDVKLYNVENLEDLEKLRSEIYA